MTAVQGTSMMDALGKDGLLRACHSDESSSHVSDEVGLMGSFMSFVLPQCPATEKTSLSEVPMDTLSLMGNGEKISVRENACSIVSIKLARDMEGLSVLMKEGLIFQEDMDMVQRLFQPSLQNHDAKAFEKTSLSEVPMDTLSLMGNGEKISLVEKSCSIVPMTLARDMEELSVLMKEGLIFQEDMGMAQRLFQPSLQKHDSKELEIVGGGADGKGNGSVFQGVSAQASESKEMKGRLGADRSQSLEMGQESLEFLTIRGVTSRDHAQHLASIQQHKLSNERILFNTSSNSANEVASSLVLETQVQQNLSLNRMEVEKREKNFMLQTQSLEMGQESIEFPTILGVTSSDHAQHLASLQQHKLSNERILFNTSSNSGNEVASSLVLETQVQQSLSLNLVEVRQSSDQGDGLLAKESPIQHGFDGSDQAPHFSEGDRSSIEGFFLGKLDAFQHNFEGAFMEKNVMTERAAMALTPTHLGVLEAIREAGVAESRRISIALRPESLGSVEICVEMSSLGQLSIFIQAEKSTTYDLLRQDASVLQQALMESGFDVQGENLHFSFGDSQNMAQEFMGGSVFQRSKNEEVFHQDSEKIEEISITNPNYVHMKA